MVKGCDEDKSFEAKYYKNCDFYFKNFVNK